MLSLHSLLLGLPILISFLLVDLLLVFVTILSFVELDLNSNKVSFHPMDHVLVRSLNHHLMLMGLLDIIQSFLCRIQPSVLFIGVLLDAALIDLSLLEFSLHHRNKH